MQPVKIQLRLGTRGSMLARVQSQMIADQLMRLHPKLLVSLVIIQTTGDVVQDRPLHEVGGKGVFTKELDEALLRCEIDCAVHSLKDVPVTMPLVDQGGLVIAAVPPREDVLDVAVLRVPSSGPLPRGARVGTSSMRRRCQLLEIAPEVSIAPIRGNIDTRIRRVRSGEFDAAILAMAGVKRAGLYDPETMQVLPVESMIPAAGQGALAVQCRADDRATRELLSALDDVPTREAVQIERQIVAGLQGDCHSPIAALAMPEVGAAFRVLAAVGARGGELPIVRAGIVGAPDTAATSVVEALKRQGAVSLLSGTRGAPKSP